MEQRQELIRIFALKEKQGKDITATEVGYLIKNLNIVEAAEYNELELEEWNITTKLHKEDSKGSISILFTDAYNSYETYR